MITYYSMLFQNGDETKKPFRQIRRAFMMMRKLEKADSDLSYPDICRQGWNWHLPAAE
jgi:hypothetical protein